MDRDDIDVLKQELEDLGATHVVTYDELEDKKAIKAKVNEWTGGQVFLCCIFSNICCILTGFCEKKGIRLGLNCVGGEPTRAMAGLLGHNAHLVTYGGMAKRHLCLPASFLIFKNLISSGFWLSQWYKTNAEGQVKLVEELARTMASGKVSVSQYLLKRGLHV
jgi:mitochondrial enoyl-[acyl-carrier protein] reductase / trans-2-enoyl-CoA reductase